MTFEVCLVWCQIEGFSTGDVLIILNFHIGLNRSKVIAKEGQKVIPTYQESLNETVFKYVISGIKLNILNYSFMQVTNNDPFQRRSMVSRKLGHKVIHAHMSFKRILCYN